MAGNAHHNNSPGPAQRPTRFADPVQLEFDSYHQPGQREIDESHIRALAGGLLKYMGVDGKVRAAEETFVPSFTRLEEGQIVGGRISQKAAKTYVTYMERRDNRLAHEADDIERRRVELRLHCTPKDLGHVALVA